MTAPIPSLSSARNSAGILDRSANNPDKILASQPGRVALLKPGRYYMGLIYANIQLIFAIMHSK
jgi:hypothetical protein